MVHRFGLMIVDANKLSKNLCQSQKDSIGVRWHVGENEKEMLE